MPGYPDQYCAANAEILCRLSAAAYDDEPAIEEGRFEVIDNKATGVRVLIVDDPDLVVAFRGTANIKDAILDAKIVMVADGNWKVHSGFYEGLLSIKDDLLKALAKREVIHPVEGKRRVWFTGHSLGGALAMLFAEEPYGVNTAGVYTFGQPRVGNGAWRNQYDGKLKDRTFRVVNAVDIVPHLPWLCGRYRHAGHEVFYEGGAATVDRSLPLYAADDAMAMVSEFISPTSAEQWLADHHVSKYQALFAAQRNSTPAQQEEHEPAH